MTEGKYQRNCKVASSQILTKVSSSCELSFRIDATFQIHGVDWRSFKDQLRSRN